MAIHVLYYFYVAGTVVGPRPSPGITATCGQNSGLSATLRDALVMPAVAGLPTARRSRYMLPAASTETDDDRAR